MSKFKIGDKVRFTAEAGPWLDWQVSKGNEGAVVAESDDEGWFYVEFGDKAEVHETDLELITPADPKREFLERLGDLLREFDAKIQVYAGEDGDCGIGFYLGDLEEYKNDIWYSKEWGRNNFNFPITADNIMDFDKD